MLVRLLPWITTKVKKSLVESDVPGYLKKHVRPLIKKLNLENYRIVSNLRLLPKVIENVVASRLVRFRYLRATAESVKNLGVYYDSSLTTEKQKNSIPKACCYHIRSMGSIRHVSQGMLAEPCPCALITSRLDCGNALLYGISGTLMTRGQRVQNSAAGPLTRTRK